MKIYLQPERVVFTLIALVGFIAQIAYMVAAYTDRDYLRRIKASPTLHLMTGPHMGSEWLRMSTMTLVLLLGIASFSTVAAPQTLFGAIASVVIIFVVAEIEIVSYTDFRRRRYLLLRPEPAAHAKKVEARENGKKNGGH